LLGQITPRGDGKISRLKNQNYRITQEENTVETKKPEEIQTHPTFESLFPINGKLLHEIEKDMRNGNYDFSQPIILATWKGQKEETCIDGHTRLRAAINAGIEEVPVFSHEFDTEQEAVEKAIKLQHNRRNMTDAEIFTCMEALDSKRARGGDRRSEAEKSNAQHCAIENPAARSSAQTGEILGISSRKVEMARTVMEHAEGATKEAVKQGDLSINQAYQKTQKDRKKSKAEPSTDTPDEQSASDGEEVEEADESEESAPWIKKELEQAPEEIEQAEERTFNEMRDQNSPSRVVTFFLPEWQHTAFIRLGGFIEGHLTKAAALYLESLGIRQEEDDDEEYFDPDSYEAD
jgi:ParB-like chromosome segregation protein Spo0J